MSGCGVTTADRVFGCLLGLAAGDRNGGPLRMALLLGQSLIDRERFDPEDVASRYLQWWRNGAFDTGPTFASVYQWVAKGAELADAVLDVHVSADGQTAGVNPAHRCPPLALAGFIPDEELQAVSRSEAWLSHLHELAGETSAAVVTLCRLLVRGREFDEALGQAVADRSRLLQRALSVSEETELGTGGFAPEAFAAGAHFVRSSRSFHEALQRSLEFAGPANYCPVITGTLAGARWGRQEISGNDLRHCAVLEQVQALAGNLSATWDSIEYVRGGSHE